MENYDLVKRNLFNKRSIMPAEAYKNAFFRQNTYQFYDEQGYGCFAIHEPDKTGCYRDEGKLNTQNQLYDICGHITRLYMYRTCVEQKPIGEINKYLKMKIFAGMTFSLEYFLLGLVAQNDTSVLKHA